MTSAGFGFSRLTNVPQSTTAAAVTTIVARAFLEESGYVGLDNCVSDLLIGLDSELDGVTGTIPPG